jgi:hypothetical protein
MMKLGFLHACIFLTIVSLPACAGDWTPDPSLGNPALHKRIYEIEIARGYCEQNFDPNADMVQLKPGDHVVREAAYCVFAPLLTGDPADRDRAQKIISNVIAAHDTRLDSAWRGAFLWRAEDAWIAVKDPDLNSAAFLGSTLTEIAYLDDKQRALDPKVRVLDGWNVSTRNKGTDDHAIGNNAGALVTSVPTHDFKIVQGNGTLRERLLL